MEYNDPTIENLLKKYNDKNNNIRIWVAKVISSIAETTTIDHFKTHIIKIVEALVVDEIKDVRINAIKQLLPLSITCKKFNKDGINIIKDSLFPLLLISLEDNDENIRKMVVSTIKEFSEYYTRDQFIPIIWHEIERLANDKRNQNNRIAAIEMINELSSVIGKQKIITYAIPLLNLLKIDPYYCVRVTILSNLESICEVLGDKTILIIFPIWEHLTKDEIWNVRNACVNSIVTLSQTFKSDDRTKLIYYFCNFMEDNNRWVKSSAYSIVGQFIQTLPKDNIFEILVHYYKESSTGICINHEGQFCDYNMITKCALSFPAVLMTLGKEMWDDTLKETFIILAHDSNPQTRNIMANSLHIVATIIRMEEIEDTLFPIIQEYMKDDDHVKLYTFSNIVTILRLLTFEVRERNMWIIDFICGKQTNEKFWRFREAIAIQIGEIISLYNFDIVKTKLIPLVKSLLTDPVAVIRNVMSKQISFVITVLSQNKEERESFYNYLISFVTRSSQNRIIFAKICHGIADMIDFTVIFLPHLLHLSHDGVSSVRLQALQSLLQINTKK